MALAAELPPLGEHAHGDGRIPGPERHRAVTGAQRRTARHSRFLKPPLDRDDPAQLRAAGATLAALHNAAPALRDPELDAWHQAFTDDPGEGLARGLVHGDFWAGNIIWGGGRVAAVIDFSEARVGVLARELAWAAWEFGDDDNHELDVDRARPFLAGYREVRGPWEPGLADVLIGLMRDELRRNARYSLADPNDIGYNRAMQRDFGRLRHHPAASLLDP